MKKYFLFFLFIGIGYSVLAQKLLTLEDALVKNRTTLATENLRQLQFIYGTEDYVYLKKITDKDVWMKGNFQTPEQTFLTLGGLNQKLKAAGSDTMAAM